MFGIRLGHQSPLKMMYLWKKTIGESMSSVYLLCVLNLTFQLKTDAKQVFDYISKSLHTSSDGQLSEQ